MSTPQTFGDLVTSLTSDTAASNAATQAALAANQAATAAAAVVTTDQSAVASALKSIGKDIIIDNGDGTFTGYLGDGSALGYHTEVFGGATTPLPSASPNPVVVNTGGTGTGTDTGTTPATPGA